MVEQATFGAGCFWCIEACFKDVKGINDVTPGYSGGNASSANYEAVCSGLTDHAEVARIEFDNTIIKFEQLLELFWFVHDPTQLNHQGNDVGRQYRSVIMYHSIEQKEKSEHFRYELDNSEAWNNPIVTEIVPVGEFYSAEDYHKNYLENNPYNPYCQSVVRPKVEKFRKVFKKMLK